MSAAAPHQQIDVSLDAEGLSGRLSIERDADPNFATFQACTMALRDAGVQVTKALSAEVEELVKRFQAAPDQGAELELRGRPPEHGQPGRFEWAPELDPDLNPDDDQDQTTVDFYRQSGFTMVAEGQTLGRVVPPTAGEDGLNLRGEPMRAKPGKPCPLKLDPASVLAGPDGQCSSLINGVLHRDNNKLWISPQLEINGYVDFHTGHINFEGDVVIRKGVRDLFEVCATGEVTVGQLIEAARFNVGTSLHARGGIAAKGRGRFDVGRDLAARYLDSVVGEVGGSVRVERECIQCQLDISGQLVIDRGAVIGGVNRVGGAVHVGELGSRAHLPTTLVLGELPEMQRMLDRLDAHLGQLAEQRDEIEAQIMRCAAEPTCPEQQKRLAELMHKGPALDQRIDELQSRRQMLHQRYEEQRTVDLRVERAVHCGTILQVGRQQLRFIESIQTRVRLGWTRGRRLMLAVGTGNLAPLDRYPQVKQGTADSAKAIA